MRFSVTKTTESAPLVATEVRFEVLIALKEYSAQGAPTDLVQLAFGTEHRDAELVAFHLSVSIDSAILPN